MSLLDPITHIAGTRSGEAPSLYLTDGGLETFLIFDRGLDLPQFASFPLVITEEGRSELAAYFEPYFEIARRDRTGFIIDTPTWRANRDWGEALGFDADAIAEVNRSAVAAARTIAARHPDVSSLVNGVIGPRGDGYVVDGVMTTHEAAKYHWRQVGAFADAGADMVTATTITYSEEAIGIVDAGRSEDLPVVIGFTVETDGRLPSGEPLLDAMGRVDAETDRGAAWFMVNCAHPSHFRSVLDRDRPELARLGAIRSNASRLSHAELDAADELDRGDPLEFGQDYVALRETLPELRVIGGCCGTDHEHIDEISRALCD